MLCGVLHEVKLETMCHLSEGLMTTTNVVLQVAAKMWRRSFLCNVAELRDLMPFLHVFILVVVQVYSILLSTLHLGTNLII